MPPVDFFGFFRASLACIAGEEPQAHRALTQAMRGLRARLTADGTARTVWFDGSEWIIDEGTEAHVAIAFDRAVVLDLVDAGLAMPEALEQERLRIYGPVEAVERLNQVLLIYLEGLMRAPGASLLLEEYREMSYDTS